MRIAFGCSPVTHYGEESTFEQFRRAFEARGISVQYVGPPAIGMPGYDNSVPLARLIEALTPRPDAFFFLEGMGYFPRGLEDVPVPSVALLGDVHLGQWRPWLARFFDAVVIPLKDHLEEFGAAVGHGQVHWLPLWLPPGVRFVPGLERDLDVGFVGNVVFAHRNTPRARRLRKVAARFKMNDYQRVHTAAELSAVYSRSKIVFNVSLNGATSYRPLEGAACGALVMTDTRANALGELFEIGKEIVLYDDDDDLLRKIDYYLHHEEERRAIAEAGQRRVMRDHQFDQRVDALAEILRNTQKRGPLRAADSPARRLARRQVYIHLYQLDALMDDSRAAGRNPLQRLYDVAPLLARRLIV